MTLSYGFHYCNFINQTSIKNGSNGKCALHLFQVKSHDFLHFKLPLQKSFFFRNKRFLSRKKKDFQVSDRKEKKMLRVYKGNGGIALHQTNNLLYLFATKKKRYCGQHLYSMHSTTDRFGSTRSVHKS